MYIYGLWKAVLSQIGNKLFYFTNVAAIIPIIINNVPMPIIQFMSISNVVPYNNIATPAISMVTNPGKRKSIRLVDISKI